MLEIRVFQAGEADWGPRRSVPAMDTTAVRETSIAELGLALGWLPATVAYPGAKRMESYLLPSFSTYFADFAPSASSQYAIDKPTGALTAFESRIVAVYDTFTCIYPPTIKYRRVNRGDGHDLVVVPDPNPIAIPYAVWVNGMQIVQVFFDCEVDLDQAQSILESIVSPSPGS